MTIFVAPNGDKFKIDMNVPEAAAFVRQHGLKPEESSGVKDFLKSSLSGLVEGIPRGLGLGGDAIKLGMTGANLLADKDLPFFSPETINQYGSQGWIDAFKDSPQDRFLKKGGLDATYEPQTTAGRYGKAGMSALSGGAVTGGLASIGGPFNAAKVALSPSAAAINTASGLASEGAMDLTQNPLVAALAGLGVGTGGNMVKQAARSNYPENLYDATKGMKPRDWRAAEDSLERLNSTNVPGGQPSALTLADVPELRTQLSGIARGLSNAPGGDALRNKLSADFRQNKEIPRLLNQAQEVTQPWPGLTTNFADDTIKEMRKINPDRLDAAIVKHMTPEEALQTAEVLGKRLRAVPNVSTGQSALNDRRLYEALIRHGDASASPIVRKNLEAADSLSRLSAESGVDTATQMTMGKHWVDWLSPGSLKLRNSLRVQRAETADLSKLLASPTKENLRKLEELAKIDPRAKRALEFISTWGAAASTSALDTRTPSE